MVKRLRMSTLFEVTDVDRLIYEEQLQDFLPQKMIDIHTHVWIDRFKAHAGRAYCQEDVGDAFEVLKDTRNMVFDFAANTNAWVFERLIRAVGPKRVLFGSDLPILRIRRICEDGTYINLVPEGMYGDVSGDKNMREVANDEAIKLTFFMYEELLAFKRAARATGLTVTDIEDIFYNNAEALLASTGKGA